MLLVIMRVLRRTMWRNGLISQSSTPQSYIIHIRIKKYNPPPSPHNPQLRISAPLLPPLQPLPRYSPLSQPHPAGNLHHAIKPPPAPHKYLRSTPRLARRMVEIGLEYLMCGCCGGGYEEADYWTDCSVCEDRGDS